jgi:hypothetical protein
VLRLCYSSAKVTLQFDDGATGDTKTGAPCC